MYCFINKMCSFEMFCILLLLVSQSQCFNFQEISRNLYDGILSIENRIEHIHSKLPLIRIPKIDVKNFCFYGECCTDEFIPANIIDLKINLTKDLFGQHIVIEELIPALDSHTKNSKSNKPLVISFHGQTGIGKNFVADRIAEFLYKKGGSSQFIHRFNGKCDFPLQSQVDQYQIEIRDKIMGAIKKCPRSYFIFDEVDKMPSRVFDTTSTLLDNHDANLHGLNFKQAIFIFISNSGGTEITNELITLQKQNVARRSTGLHNFERILIDAKGGIIELNKMDHVLVDLFVPFLPLTRKHVENCIRAEFNNLGTDPKQEIVNEIVEKYVIFDKHNFSEAGCKRIIKKIGIYASKL